MYKVYMHVAPNGKKYIGITKLDLKARWQNGKGYKSNILFYRAINKYGWENINHILLFKNMTKEEAEKKEIELIKKLNTTNTKYGYNIEKGGNHVGKVSEKTKEKLRISHLGIKYSIETKEKHRILALKQWETQKIFRKKNGIKNIFYGIRKTIPVICVETQKHFNTIKEASIFYNICDESIRKCIHKKRITAGGYHWKPFEEGKI